MSRQPAHGSSRPNVDERTVSGFGDEWTRFDQAGAPPDELERISKVYFALFPWQSLPRNGPCQRL